MTEEVLRVELPLICSHIKSMMVLHIKFQGLELIKKPSCGLEPNCLLPPTKPFLSVVSFNVLCLSFLLWEMEIVIVISHRAVVKMKGPHIHSLYWLVLFIFIFVILIIVMKHIYADL